MTPAAAAAAAGAFAPDGSNMSSYSGVMAPASSTVSVNSSSRPPAASVTAANPMSRQSAAQRGLQVDEKGVVVQPKAPESLPPFSSLPGLNMPPQINAGHMPLIMPMGLTPGAPTSMQVGYSCSVSCNVRIQVFRTKVYVVVFDLQLILVDVC
jgi:hypothetical protein